MNSDLKVKNIELSRSKELIDELQRKYESIQKDSKKQIENLVSKLKELQVEHNQIQAEYNQINTDKYFIQRLCKDTKYALEITSKQNEVILDVQNK